MQSYEDSQDENIRHENVLENSRNKKTDSVQNDSIVTTQNNDPNYEVAIVKRFDFESKL